jgi:hypothetical protein
MRLAIALVALAAAAACAVSASAGSAAKDPLRLVLQRSDFPAKARWSKAKAPTIEKSLAGAGLQGKAASYSAEIYRGSTDSTLVSGLVVVFPSTAQARRAFPLFNGDLRSRRREVVRVPAFGDEQVALVPTEFGPRGDLRVRQGAVVWRLEIKWASTERHTRAQTLAELKTHAAKQKERIGRG